VPREFTAVPAARSSDKAFRAKQSFVLGAVLFAALLGPLAAVLVVTTRVDVPKLRNELTSGVLQAVDPPSAMLATSDLIARAWTSGAALNVPKIATVVLTPGKLDVIDVERVTHTEVPLSEAGLSPKRYASAWKIVYRALRTDGSLAFITIPMAITVQTTTALADGATVSTGSVPLLRAAPYMETFLYPVNGSELGRDDQLVPANWTKLDVASSDVLVQQAQRFITAYLADALSTQSNKVLEAPADGNTDGIDDVIEPPPAALQARAGEVGGYRGLGGMTLAPNSTRIISGPYRPSAENTTNTGQVLMTVSFGALASASTAPTINSVAMTMDLLIKADTNTILAWGPAGSGPTLTPHQNHTAYRIWEPPVLSE
jgi:hypothetical protein